MSDKIYKNGNIKNRGFLADKNRLPLADKINEETIAKTIKEKNDLLKDSVAESVTEQEKNKTTRIPIKGENTTEYFKNNKLPEPEQLPKPEVQASKLNQVISKVDDFIEKSVPQIDNIVEKVAPYIDDVAKGIGSVAKIGGVAGGVIGFLNPESTATDEEMKQLEIESQNRLQQENNIPPRLDEIQEIKILSIKDKENILEAFNNMMPKQEPPYLQDINRKENTIRKPMLLEIEFQQPEFEENENDFNDDDSSEGDEG